MVSDVTRWILQLLAQKFSEVQASVWNLFKSFAEPGTKIKTTFESIIYVYFGEFLEDWSISKFYFYFPPVLMSTILFCLSELLAGSFASEEQKNGDFSPHFWFVEQKNSYPHIFRAWAHVECKWFTGTHERNCSQGDISFWQTDAQWYSNSGFISLLESLSRKQTLWSVHLKPIVPLAPFSSDSASSSSNLSSYQPLSHASEVKLDTTTDQYIMFLQCEITILDYLQNKPYLLPDQKKDSRRCSHKSNRCQSLFWTRQFQQFWPHSSIENSLISQQKLQSKRMKQRKSLLLMLAQAVCPQRMTALLFRHQLQILIGQRCSKLSTFSVQNCWSHRIACCCQPISSKMPIRKPHSDAVVTNVIVDTIWVSAAVFSLAFAWCTVACGLCAE
jgi:hypothetical protein